MTRRIKLPFTVNRPILACGADMKGAFAIAKGREAIIVDGFGDLSDLDNFKRYEKKVKAEIKKMRITPGLIACDMHPGYFSTQFAESLISQFKCARLIKVQHHAAHAASAIVDNSIKGNVIGVAFDGTGFGLDGNIWGGEFFAGNLKKFKRVAHFDYVAMPGGEKAILQPWRMAASYFYKLKKHRSHFKKQKLVEAMIDGGINSPLTSSVGRLFDAVGCLVFSIDVITKEAELPIGLERIAAFSDGKYDYYIKSKSGILKIDGSKIIEGVMKDLSKKVNKGKIAAKFHNTMADIILKVSLKLSERFATKKIVLTGGVFQNKRLSEDTVSLLEARGLSVYRHSVTPTNDSGIPIGQIAIANMRTRCA